jgi:hypothetical protein
MHRKHRNYKKKTLRNKKFRGGDVEEDVEEDECPICSISLEDGRPTIETNCFNLDTETIYHHKFHRVCLRNWCNSGMAKRNRCPLCQANIVATCHELNQDAVNQPIINQPIVNQPIINQPTINEVWPLEPYVNFIPDEDAWIAAGFPPILNNSEWSNMEYDLWKTIPNPDGRITRYVTSIRITGDGQVNRVNADINKICVSFPNLLILDVKYTRIARIPDTIANLTKLTKLDMPDNLIDHLPNSIGNLTELTYIDLARNRITHLPNSMGNLKKLKNVYLTYNNIPADDIVAMFADPYWNNKQVSLEADNIHAVDNRLPYKFKINGYSENNSNSTRSRTSPLTAGFAQGKSRKYRRRNRRTNRRTNKRINRKRRSRRR